jgi:hypothetical protein|tara:strand:+ start:3531 stop:4583 length:1053 start_codon:yes stop_codon:yes gene_type:complete
MATLEEIRAKLAEQEKKTSGGGQVSDNAIFPFWNIPEGTTSTLRFLPDANKDNTFFWVERAMIKLPFPGIKGQADTKPTIVQVPCMEMFNEPCPVLAEVRTWFKDPALEDMGRKYWKKRSYIFQGFVVNSTLDEETTPENPIRRFVINPSIFNIIRSALMNPEMEDLPTDNESGRDFKLTKTQKGGYADYSTSTWSFKARSLGESERSAIDQYGLHNLSDYMPKKPSQEELNIIQEMFKASVDGELYDPDRFGQYYKPAGFSNNSSSGGSTATAKPVETVAPAVAPATETVAQPVQSTPEPAKVEVTETVTATASEQPAPATASATATETGGKVSAEDILSMIRSRQAGK